MLKALDAVKVSRLPTPWISPPGVVRGCEVSIGSGLEIHVNPGKFVTLNGYSVEVLDPIATGAYVPVSDGQTRRDYVVALVHKNSVVFRHMKDVAEVDPLNQNPKGLAQGIALAKLFVTYPTASPSSIYVYNAVPVRGEGLVRTFSPLTIPDGVKTSFLFPFKVPAAYCMEIMVGGIPQTEGAHYTRTLVTAQDGSTNTIVTFDEAPASVLTIIANIYLGHSEVVGS